MRRWQNCKKLIEHLKKCRVYEKNGPYAPGSMHWELLYNKG